MKGNSHSENEMPVTWRQQTLMSYTNYLSALNCKLRKRGWERGRDRESVCVYFFVINKVKQKNKCTWLYFIKYKMKLS